MASLNDYSIESNEVILLKFNDGRSLRSRVEDLPKHLTKDDLRRVNDALKLRANYISKHLPNWLKVLLFFVLSITIGSQTTKAVRVIEQYISRQTESHRSTSNSAGNTPSVAPLPQRSVPQPARESSEPSAPQGVSSGHSNGIGQTVSTTVKELKTTPESVGPQLKLIIQQLKQTSGLKSLNNKKAP